MKRLIYIVMHFKHSIFVMPVKDVGSWRDWLYIYGGPLWWNEIFWYIILYLKNVCVMWQHGLWESVARTIWMINDTTLPVDNKNCAGLGSKYRGWTSLFVSDGIIQSVNFILTVCYVHIFFEIITIFFEIHFTNIMFELSRWTYS